MTRAEYTAELERLRRAYKGQLENPLSLNCERCEGCVSCNFSKGCRDCYRCTHFVDCEGCSGCSHCKGCAGCHESSHCERSRGFRGSAYLVECEACSDCTYCFGCVGLTKKEFHILNVAYSRTEYLALIKALR